jgi:hypothetical protein
MHINQPAAREALVCNQSGLKVSRCGGGLQDGHNPAPRIELPNSGKGCVSFKLPTVERGMRRGAKKGVRRK